MFIPVFRKTAMKKSTVLFLFYTQKKKLPPILHFKKMLLLSATVFRSFSVPQVVSDS